MNLVNSRKKLYISITDQSKLASFWSSNVYSLAEITLGGAERSYLLRRVTPQVFFAIASVALPTLLLLRQRCRQIEVKRRREVR